MSPPRLVLATRNPGKLAEFQRLLGGSAALTSLAGAAYLGDLPEPGATYAENARAKAEAVRDALGLPALADDSGIEVRGLGGWPGPRSARWMGEEANDRDRLLGLLARVAAETPDDRCARYVAAVALARPGMPTVTTEGIADGVLVDPPRGTGGFGYDPAFLSDELGDVTFAEAGAALKDSVSHRARALRALLQTGVLDAL